MALITCKDCKANFSTDAPRCPTCGAKKPPTKLDIIKGIFALFYLGGLIFLFIFIAHSCSEMNEKDAAAAMQREAEKKAKDVAAASKMGVSLQQYKAANEALINASSNCKVQVEQMAKWGAEADWTPNGTWKTDGTIMTIEAHDVKFKNGFGASAYIRYECLYNIATGVAVITDVEDY